MTDEKKLPKPSVETLNEFDDLCQKLQDPQLSSEQSQKVTDRVNEIIKTYDFDNYAFTDPATGKKGVKNPVGQLLVPAEYEGFTFLGDYNMCPLPHIAAKKDGKFGVVAADGTGTVLCDFRFDQLLWNPFIGLYQACWDGVKDKFGFVNKEGEVFIPNILDKVYEPWNDFMLLEADGKFGALDVRTLEFVLPEYDKIGDEVECDVIFYKDEVPGYVDEATGTFVPVADFKADEERYDDCNFFNTYLND